MNFSWITWLLFAGFLLAMLAFAEIGRRIGIGQITRDPEGLPKGIGATEGGVFALLGLLLAFSFSGAASRFEARRHLITAETNAIGTAYLRIDLLPADARPEMRDLFRRYLDSRLATYRNPRDQATTRASLAEDVALQGQIWAKAVNEALRPEAPTQAVMLLAGISLVSGLLVGYGAAVNKGRSWLHTLIFAVVLSLTTFVIIDLEFPRLGLIRVDAADQALVELRESMR
jgi:hypothetical protein